MKTTYLTLVISLIFGMVIFGNYTSKISEESDNSSLLYMLEEEKLAQDVYTFLFLKWETKQFGNIKESEKVHVEKIQELLDRYNIPYKILPEGKFNNAQLQKLYNDLTAKGKISEIDALKVGATIEDVDIFDLQRLTKDTKNQDIINVYNFLECASKNHLRAFNRGLEMRNETYQSQYISKTDFKNIINADHEQCGIKYKLQCNGKNLGKGLKNGNGYRNCMNK